MVRRGKVRGPQWTRVSRGLYRPRASDSPLHDDLRAWQLALPATGCFTHLTGALVRGWAVPPLPPDLPVFAGIARCDPRPRRPGLLISRHAEPIHYDELGGLRVARAAEIMLAVGRDLGLLDLVVLADSALRLGACSEAELHKAGTRRRRGAPALRLALAYVDGRSESAWETVLRLLHQLSGVPVEAQYVIRRDTGSYRADLRIVGTRRLAEYDGEVHRGSAQHAKDLLRERELHRLGWQRYGYTSRVLLHGSRSVLRDADEALGRAHEPARIRPWHRALAESLFTPAGTQRLRSSWTEPRSGQLRDMPSYRGGTAGGSVG